MILDGSVFLFTCERTNRLGKISDPEIELKSGLRP